MSLTLVGLFLVVIMFTLRIYLFTQRHKKSTSGQTRGLSKLGEHRAEDEEGGGEGKYDDILIFFLSQDINVGQLN